MDTIPVYAWLHDQLRGAPVGTSYRTKETFKRSESTYTGLAEVTLLGASVHGVGFFPTTARPSDEEFVPIALEAYRRISAEGGWASTGQWLEELIKEYGVHPLVARKLLQSAAERGLLKRFFEGSTTDTKMDRHAIRVLGVRDGTPFVKTEHLYRGDFVMPGRGGSSVRIVEANHEPA